MTWRARVVPAFACACLIGGILLLAFSQSSAVLPNLERTELQNLEDGDVVGGVPGVILSGLLVTAGLLLLLRRASIAPRLPKAIALTVFGGAFPIFWTLQTLLLVNGKRMDVSRDSYAEFSAGYFFHTGQDLTLPAVYVLFAFCLLLVFLLLGSAAYLLSPTRFPRAIAHPMNWAKNEAVHVAAALLLLSSLAVLVYALGRLARSGDRDALVGEGLIGENLIVLTGLLAFCLGGLALVVAAHAFLLNWGSHGPLDFSRLVESLRTIARIERALVIGAVVVNTLILLGPTLPLRPGYAITNGFAFSLTPRGLSYATYVLLLPYLPYYWSQQRLDFLLRAGRAPRLGGLFADRSLRLVLIHVLGLVLWTTLAVAQRWDPLPQVLVYALWTASILLAYAVRIESGTGLPRIVFAGDSGPPYYFAFLGLAITSGLMLWGMGNTFEASFHEQVNVLSLSRQAESGSDVLMRMGAVALLVGVSLLTLNIWLGAVRVKRRFFGHYLALFLLLTVTVLLAFTVGVWRQGDGAREAAYTGFAFRENLPQEEFLVGTLLVITAMYAFYALGRIIGPVTERAPMAQVSAAITVRWQ